MDSVIFRKCKVDTFVCNKNAFTETETATIGETLFNKVQWDWGDFSTPQILCNYTNTVNSDASSATGTSITGYSVYRKKYGENFETEIATIDITDETQQQFELFDRDTESNMTFNYAVYPKTATIFEQPFVGIDTSSPVRNVNIQTRWEGYSLVPLLEMGENQYGIRNISNSDFPVWNFFIGADEGDLTQNQDKQAYTTFAETPKIMSGRLNYFTGNLSCYLGNVLCNGQYYEPLETLILWTNFVADNHICLLKNPKGDSFIVSIDANSTRKYDNEIANYYYGTNYDVTCRPTNLSFSFTEVKKKKDVEIKTVII